MRHSLTFFCGLAGKTRTFSNIDINKTHSQKTIFLLLIIQLLCCSFCFTQPYSQLSTSDTITIRSKIFDTERKVIITKSLKIKNDLQNNCIIYMDADDSNINGIFLQSANNLMAYDEIPQSYLVGIIHENRNTELLEKDKLLKFLMEEVIPLLNDKFSIANQLTIAGHSFGGYFATYAFIKENVLFNSCIAISPAYWPNKSDVLDLLHQNVNIIHGNFYLTIGNKRWDDISLRKYVFKAQNIVKNKSNIFFNFTDLKGFSHNATPTVGFGAGLSFIYDEWEWQKILIEQERNLKSFPGFWGHTEIKADALFHLQRVSEAKVFYKEALKNVSADNNLPAQEKKIITKRLKHKIKSCRQKKS